IEVSSSASAYTITGANSITVSEGFTYNGTRNDDKFTVPMTLGANNELFTSANVGAQIELGDINLQNLQTLISEGRGNFKVTGNISGTGGITKIGDGTLILAGANTFEGLVDVTQGVVSGQSAGAFGSSTTGGTIVRSGAAVEIRNTGAATATMTVPEN